MICLDRHLTWTTCSLFKVLFGDIPLAYFFSCELVVEGTADGKDNKEEKTIEVAEIRM